MPPSPFSAAPSLLQAIRSSRTAPARHALPPARPGTAHLCVAGSGRRGGRGGGLTVFRRTRPDSSRPRDLAARPSVRRSVHPSAHAGRRAAFPPQVAAAERGGEGVQAGCTRRLPRSRPPSLSLSLSPRQWSEKSESHPPSPPLTHRRGCTASPGRPGARTREIIYVSMTCHFTFGPRRSNVPPPDGLTTTIGLAIGCCCCCPTSSLGRWKSGTRWTVEHWASRRVAARQYGARRRDGTGI